MSHTVVGLRMAMRDGLNLFGEDSDRHSNDAHHLLAVAPA
jgi:hypothetical protein